VGLTRAKVGMWQLWQATLSVWSLALEPALWGVALWHDSQVILECQIVFDQAFAVGRGRVGVDSAGDVVKLGGVAADAVEILPVGAHVDVQGLVWFGQGRVQVAVFDPVSAAAVKMAGTAVLTCRQADALNGCLDLGCQFGRHFL
jgi:hypothetical protein